MNKEFKNNLIKICNIIDLKSQGFINLNKVVLTANSCPISIESISILKNFLWQHCKKNDQEFLNVISFVTDILDAQCVISLFNLKYSRNVEIYYQKFHKSKINLHVEFLIEISKFFKNLQITCNDNEYYLGSKDPCFFTFFKEFSSYFLNGCKIKELKLIENKWKASYPWISEFVEIFNVLIEKLTDKYKKDNQWILCKSLYKELNTKGFREFILDLTCKLVLSEKPGIESEKYPIKEYYKIIENLFIDKSEMSSYFIDNFKSFADMVLVNKKITLVILNYLNRNIRLSKSCWILQLN